MLHTYPIAVPSLDDALRASVDVVIPVRDGGRTIGATLSSVLCQTMKPRRIIVVNDGSTDDTVEVITRVGDGLVELITTRPVGVSHARNIGIAASRAEFVAFLDADDRWHPDKLRRQLQVFSTNADAAVVCCGFAEVQPSGELTNVHHPVLRGSIFDQVLLGRITNTPTTIVVRREALLAIGGYDEDLSNAEDLDLVLRLARRYRFDYAPEVLAHVIANPFSVTRRPIGPDGKREMLLQSVSAYEKWSTSCDLPHYVAQNLRKRIVYTAVTEGYGWRWMLQVQRDMQHRSPVSARRIWPNHAVFVGWILFAMPGFAARRLARAGRTALRRRQSPEVAAPAF